MAKRDQDDVAAELEILREEAGQLSQQIEKLEAENERLSIANRSLTSQVTRLEQLLGANATLESAEARKQRQSLETAQAEIGRLQAQVAELEAQIATESGEYAELATALEESRSSQATLEAGNARLKAEITRAEREAASAVNELVRVRHRKNVLEKECSLLRSQFTEVEVQSQLLFKEWEEITNKATGLETAIDGANQAFGEISSFLLARIQEQIGTALKSGVVNREQFALQSAQAVLDASFITSLASRVQELCRVSQPERLVTSTRTMSFSDILQSLSNSQARGVVKLSTDDAVIEVLLDRSQIVFLNPRKLKPLLGATLVCACGHSVPRDHFEELLSHLQQPGDSIYFGLADQGVLPPDSLKRFMHSIGVSVTADCLEHPERCQIEFTESKGFGQRFESQGLAIPVQRFLMQVCSQMDEMKLVISELGGLAKVYRQASRPEGDQGEELNAEYTAVLEAVNGTRNVLQVSEALEEGLLDVARSLFKLKQAGIIEEVA